MYYLNAKHTDGRTKDRLAGPTGQSLLFGDLDQARTIAQKYLRPGWTITIMRDGMEKADEPVEEVTGE
jgi:hypothetical protein